MRIHRLAACLLLASTALLGRAQVSSNTCYAIADGANNSTSQDQLVTIDKITGVTTSIGNTGTFDGESLALWPNNDALFTCDNAQLVRLNLATGAKTVIGPATQTVNGSLGSIVINDVDGLTFDSTVDPPILYAAARRGTSPQNDLLLIISTNTGLFVSNAFGPGKDYIAVSNLTVNGNVVLHDVDDIAHDPSTDTMYGILNNGGTEDHLVTIDLATGASTDVGLLSIDDAEGLSFFVDGSLFVTTGNAAPTTERNRLYDIDKATGNASNPRQITGNVDWEGSTCFTSVTTLVGDKVWRDLDQNGIQDPGEPGVPNVTVRIYRVAGNTLVQTKQTDPQGEYSFVVTPDDYYITFTLPSGYSFTALNAPGSTAANDSDANTSTGQTANFTQSPNETDLSVNAGLICNDPVVSCPPNITLECPANTTPGVTGTATATSPCGCALTVTFADTPTPLCGATFSILRRWTATDQCGNSSFCDQTITVQDTTDPVLSGVPGNASASCSSIPAPPTVTAADECDTVVPVVLSVTTNAGACAQSYSLVRTWTATDDCGNQISQSQTITVTDTVAPVISGVGFPGVVQCEDPVVFSTPTAADVCDPAPVLTFSDNTVPGSCAQSFTRTRTWTATDACGNSSTASQTITVLDTNGPEFSNVGGPLAVECDQPIVFSSPSVADTCDPQPSLTFSDATVPGSCPQNFTRTRTWTAIDACGNESTESQAITVRDTVAPVISGVGGPSTLECTAPIVFSTPAATDNCDTTPTLTFSDATVPGTCPQNFVRTRTWTATDDCGNSSTASQAITVRDTVAPVISGVGGPSILECTAPIVFSTPTATDNCDTTPTLTFSDATVPGTCPQNFVRTRTWTATDDCGNSSTASQAITVRDTVAPVISGVGGPSILECTAPIVFSTPTATDNCDTTPTLTFSDTTVPGSCPQNFARTRTWTATDDCGNSSTASQAITVRDTVAPVISGVGGPSTIECTAPLNFGNPTATDNCDTTPTLTFSDVTVPGTCPQNFVRTRTWTATDDCGNSSTASRSITVRDTVAPVVTCPAPITLECGAAIPAANPSSVLAVDSCDPTPVVTHVSDVSNGLLCPRTITRTYRAADACGNAATCTQLITVQDTTAPVQVGTLADQLVQCDSQVPPPLQPVMTDACDTNLAYSVQIVTQFSTVPGNCSKTILYRWTIRDDCNNFLRVNQRVIVRDRTRPVITCPAPVTLVGDLNCQAAIPVLSPVVTDNCDPSPTVTQIPEAGTLLGPGTHTVTITARDVCGNTQSCTATVTIECPALPGIQILKSVYLGHDGGASCPGLEKVYGMASTPVTYCFLVINTGEVALVNVTITDPILNLTASVGNLGVGQSATRFAETTLTQDLVNVATGTGTPPSGPPVSDTDPAEVKRIVPSITIQKTVQNGAGAPCPGLELVSALNGDALTYCFTVTNTGDTPLRNVMVSDDLLGIPPFLVGVNGLLNVGQSVSTQLTAVANGNVTNVAGVTGYPPMGPPVSDVDPAQVVTVGPGVRYKKTVYAGNNGVAGCPGDDHLGITGPTQVTYCFEVTNTGDLPLLNVVIRDPALAYTNTVGNVPVGQTVYRAVAALVSSSVTNVATATMKPGTGLLTVTNSAVVGLYSPSLQINKRIFAGHGDAAACDTAGDNLSAPLNSPVTYCFEVVNTGDTHLNNITVFDNNLALGDTAMEFIRGAFPLPPGQSVLYTYKALVQGALVNTASALANAATPEAKRIGGLPNSTDSDSAVLQVAPPQP